MKYYAEYMHNDQMHTVEFDFYGRYDRNLFMKAATAVFRDLYNRDYVDGSALGTMKAEYPNIWTNGAVGSLVLIINHKIHYHIAFGRKGCGYIAM